jgi:hypothetical protein
MAAHCRDNGIQAVLMIDEASSHLYEINDLTDRLLGAENNHLKLLLVATRHQWNPRIKSATIYRFGKEFKLVQLWSEEVERLLQLVDLNPSIRALVEPVSAAFRVQSVIVVSSSDVRQICSCA